MFHWAVRKNDKIVSTLSSVIEKDIVSFWNGATLPEARHQGLMTALACFALQDAISKKCRIGASYLLPERSAFSICNKLGGQTKWRFSAFLSPAL